MNKAVLTFNLVTHMYAHIHYILKSTDEADNLELYVGIYLARRKTFENPRTMKEKLFRRKYSNPSIILNTDSFPFYAECVAVP